MLPSLEYLIIDQLAAHKFIVSNVKEFHLIDIRQVSNKFDTTKRNIVIDIKKNKSLEDEDKLINIIADYLAPIIETNYSQNNNVGIPNNYNSPQNYRGPILPNER